MTPRVPRTVTREEFQNAARVIRETSRDARGREIVNLSSNRMMEWMRDQERQGRRIPLFTARSFRQTPGGR